MWKKLTFWFWCENFIKKIISNPLYDKSKQMTEIYLKVLKVFSMVIFINKVGSPLLEFVGSLPCMQYISKISLEGKIQRGPISKEVSCNKIICYIRVTKLHYLWNLEYNSSTLVVIFVLLKFLLLAPLIHRKSSKFFYDSLRKCHAPLLLT